MLPVKAILSNQPCFLSTEQAPDDSAVQSATPRKCRMEANVSQLERRLEAMRATYRLKEEKLRYNERVLKERLPESQATIAHQKRRLATQQQLLTNLKASCVGRSLPDVVQTPRDTLNETSATPCIVLEAGRGGMAFWKTRGSRVSKRGLGCRRQSLKAFGGRCHRRAIVWCPWLSPKGCSSYVMHPSHFSL